MTGAISATTDELSSINSPAVVAPLNSADHLNSVGLISPASYADGHRSVFTENWRAFIALAAFLDFTAVVVDRLVVDNEEEGSSVEGVPELWESTVRWLQLNASFFSFTFSLLWFFDAFLEAKRRRELKLKELDSARLAAAENEQQHEERIWSNPWLVFIMTMTVQLLFLPLGFYANLYNFLRRLQDPTMKDSDMPARIIYHDSEMSLDQAGVYDGRIALGFVLIQISVSQITKRIGEDVKARLVATAKKTGKRLWSYALRHPFQSARRMRMILQAIRYVKYLGPLIGNSNKLRANLGMLYARYKQRRAAEKAKIVRMMLWRELSQEELREYGAKLIQKTYRSHRMRKAAHALRLVRGDKETFAALKLQKAFRARLEKARARIQLARKELAKLEAKEKLFWHQNQQNEQIMSADERKRMYQLRQELRDDARDLINKRLLMRPNTSFAVIWKTLFVVVVILEIFGLAVNPILRRRHHVDLETIVLRSILPVPFATLKECSRRMTKPWPKLIRFLQGFVKRLTSKFERQMKPDEYLPWYCLPPNPGLQEIYSDAVTFLVHNFYFFVTMVEFADVFVMFFTGEFNPKNGTLEPKPFFERWILPGICLQLVVNPNMGLLAKQIPKLGTIIMRRGPIRVFRWTVVLFYPAFLLFLDGVQDFWMSQVERQHKL